MTLPNFIPSCDPEKQHGASIWSTWVQPSACAEVAKRQSSTQVALFIATYPAVSVTCRNGESRKTRQRTPSIDGEPLRAAFAQAQCLPAIEPGIRSNACSPVQAGNEMFRAGNVALASVHADPVPLQFMLNPC